jgi:hypothetical protein
MDFECGSAVLEKLLQPPVKHCRLQLVAITNTGYGFFFDEVPPEDRDFLLGCVSFSEMASSTASSVVSILTADHSISD